MAVATDEPVRESRANRKRWLSRYRWWLLAVALLLLWAAPLLVSRTPLLRLLVERATQDLAGRVDYASASLGWFSSGEIRGVQLLDPSNQVIAEIESVQIQKSLWQLLWSRDDFGLIRIVRPQLHLEIENNVSNLELAVAPLLQEDSEASTSTLVLEVSEGVATCEYLPVGEPTATKRVELDDISGTVRLGVQQQVQMRGRVWRSLAEAKSGSLTLTFDSGRKDRPYEISVELLDVDLGLLNAGASRFGINLTSHGVVTGKLDGWMTEDGSAGEIMLEEVSALDVEIRAPDYLRDDQPKMKQVSALGHVAWSDYRLQFHSLQLESDFVSADVKGMVDLNDIRQLWRSEGSEVFEAQGQIDLAAATKQLPSTLKLREGVTVNQGLFQWVIRSHQQAGQRRLFANVTTGPMQILDRGKSIALNQPLELSGAIIQSGGQPSLEFISCRSPFLAVNGSGTIAQGKVNIEGSFDELQQYIRQYLAIDGLALAGQIEGEITWSEDRLQPGHNSVASNGQSRQEVHLGGDLVLRNVDCTWQGQPLLVETELSLSGRTVWRPGAGIDEILRQTDLQVLAQEDRLELTSAASLTPSSEQVNGPEEQPRFVLRGDLQRWANRLGVRLLPDGMAVGGEMECTGRLVWQAKALQVADGAVTLRDFWVQSEEVSLQEPLVVGNCALEYDWDSSHLVVELLTLASTSVSLRLDQWVLPLMDSPEMMQGQYAVRADLARLSSWFRSIRELDWKTVGQLEGHGQLSKQKSVNRAVPLGFDFVGTIHDFSIGGPQELSAAGSAEPTNWQWSEPRVAVSFQGAYDLENQFLQIPLGEIEGSGQSLVVQGNLSAKSKDWHIDASGRWKGVGHPWFRLLTPWLGDDAELKGSFDEAFAIQGSLAGLTGDAQSGAVRAVSWPNETLVGHAGLAWQSGRVLGLSFGTGAIRPSLSQQCVDFGQIHIPLSQGDIRMDPDLLLGSESPTLKVAAGRILDRVVLTPELSRRWLVYVAPMLAQITQAQGIISLDVQESRFPIEQLELAEGRGVLEIEQAVVGPGPLAMQVLELVTQIRALVTQQSQQSLNRETWLELPKQQIQFQIQQGRVYHDQMRIQMGEVVVLTRGSVGHDESIDLMMSIPIQDDWVASRPELAGLQGLTVNVPVKGTLSKPKVDTKVLGELSKQLVRQAAGQLIDQQLQRGLQKLLGGGQ